MERDVVERIGEACEPGNWHKVSHKLLEDAAAEVEHLRKLLNGRDDFIISSGLWETFVAGLPR